MFRHKLYRCNSPKYKQTRHTILLLLAKQSMNKHEISKATGLNNSTIANYLYFLREEGLVYICKYEDNPIGKPTPRFRFGASEDVTYISNKEPKPRKTKEKEQKIKMPRCDVAASWLNNPC